MSVLRPPSVCLPSVSAAATCQKLAGIIILSTEAVRASDDEKVELSSYLEKELLPA